MDKHRIAATCGGAYLDKEVLVGLLKSSELSPEMADGLARGIELYVKIDPKLIDLDTVADLAKSAPNSRIRMYAIQQLPNAKDRLSAIRGLIEDDPYEVRLSLGAFSDITSRLEISVFTFARQPIQSFKLLWRALTS